MVCPRCNLVNPDDAAYCKVCGHSFQADTGATGLFVDEGPETIPSTEQHAASEVAAERTSGYGYYAALGKLPYGTRRVKKRYLANWSLALGVAGMPLLWLLLALFLNSSYERQFRFIELLAAVAVILFLLVGGLAVGIYAFRRSTEDPKSFAPTKTAFPGLAVSAAGLILFPLVTSLAIPYFLAARRAANESEAIMKVKRIAAAQAIYRTSVGNGLCGDIEAMPGLTLLDLETARLQSNGYNFYIAHLPEGGCDIHAVPTSVSEGDHSFYYSTADGQLRSGLMHGKPAGPGSPLIGRPTTATQTAAHSPR